MQVVSGPDIGSFRQHYAPVLEAWDAFVDPVRVFPVYLVLRLDKGGDDPKWTASCREAANALVYQLRLRRHLDLLASDIEKVVNQLDREGAEGKF